MASFDKCLKSGFVEWWWVPVLAEKLRIQDLSEADADGDEILGREDEWCLGLVGLQEAE